MCWILRNEKECHRNYNYNYYVCVLRPMPVARGVEKTPSIESEYNYEIVNRFTLYCGNISLAFLYSIKSLFCVKFRMKFDVMVFLLLNLVQWVLRWHCVSLARNYTHESWKKVDQKHSFMSWIFQLKSYIRLNRHFNTKIWFPGKWAALKWQR